MTDRRPEEIIATMQETEEMWFAICNNVNEERVDMLVQSLVEQYTLVMSGEENADVIMALIGFISSQVLHLSQDSGVNIEAAMVLLQVGMQRGVQAHLAVQAAHGLES
jgi:cystathionine beta-lyase family protein involved in aluminum resistance